MVGSRRPADFVVDRMREIILQRAGSRLCLKRTSAQMSKCLGRSVTGDILSPESDHEHPRHRRRINVPGLGLTLAGLLRG